MIERLLDRSARLEIREYAKDRWDARRWANGKMDADTAALVQEDVFRFIRKRKVRSIWSMILMQIALKYAAKLITNWLEGYIDAK